MKHIILSFICCLIFCFISCQQNKKLEQLNVNDIIVIQGINSKREFFKAMKEKQYNFYSYKKCDSAVSLKDIKRYGIRKWFNNSKQIINDSIIIKFDFIDDCCLEHIGHLTLAQDTVKLSYENISTTACDCYCKYSYIFALSKKIYEKNSIQLNNKKYQQ
jgi:hypothetical protein